MEPFISQEVLLSTLEVLLLFQDQMVKQEQMMIQLSTLNSPVVPGDNGSVTLPGGGTASTPNGNITLPGGTVVDPDGTIHLPGGDIVNPDGTVTLPGQDG
jgi:protein involved in polysaccharide export with SLBB domain